MIDPISSALNVTPRTVDTLAEAPQSALSGVARVLVHAGKLNAKTAEDLVKSAKEKKRQLRLGGDRRRRGLARRPGAHAVERAGAAAARPRRGRPAAAAAQRHRRQAGGAVPGRRARQARQPPVHRRRRPDRPGSGRAHQVRDPAVARVGHRRARQARQDARGDRAPAPARRSSRWSSGDFEFDVTDDDTAPAGSGGGRRRGRGRAGRALPAEDADRRDQRARVRPALRALRIPLPRALPRRRRTARDHAAADRDQGQAGLAHQGHLAAWTSPRSACRRTAA